MKKYLKRSITAMLIGVSIQSCFLGNVSAYVDLGKESSYVYDKDGKDLKIPDAYEYKRTIPLKNTKDVNITSPTDMFVSSTNDVYILDSETGSIICFDKDLNYVQTIQSLKTKDGQQTKLKKPEGIFVTGDKTYYIADTGNGRVLVADKDLNIKMEIGMPKDLLGTKLSSFLPIKVVVDNAGRISISARNLNSGIMQFTAEGEFTGYTGAPSVPIDPFTRILRKFSTQAQRAQMQLYVPTEYNNIKIDGSNFIWGTISSISASDLAGTISKKDLSGKITPIKKLNTIGSDVLRRKGVFPPVGDLNMQPASSSSSSSNNNVTQSKIVDVGIGPNNIYTLLDSTLGRMFTYNNDGILLYAFGNKGNRKGDTQTPISIDYVGDHILVLDSGLGQIIEYEPTNYGSLLIGAEKEYSSGNYEGAYNKWAQVAELNSNFEYAYIGLGNAKYNNKEYKTAMEYYKYSDDKIDYSKAKEKQRRDDSKEVFPIVFTGILSLAGLYVVYVSFKKVRKYARGK